MSAGSPAYKPDMIVVLEWIEVPGARAIREYVLKTVTGRDVAMVHERDIFRQTLGLTQECINPLTRMPYSMHFESIEEAKSWCINMLKHCDYTVLPEKLKVML